MIGLLIPARYCCAAAIVAAVILMGCSKQESLPPAAPLADPAASAAVAAPITAGQHLVVGKAPITNTGTPAIVILEPQHKTPLPEPAHPAWLDQASRTFFPPIVFARSGHPTEFRNSDPELHNINVKDISTREQAFNIALPPDEKYVYTFERAGLYDVTCDVHAGMSAQIIASTSPYATVTDNEGNFTFPDVVPGSYEVTVYAGKETIQHIIEVTGSQTDVDVADQ